MSQPTTLAAPARTTETRSAPLALDVVAAVLGIGLSVVIWWLVRGEWNGGSVGAALLAVTMTLPVVAVRRYPVTVAVVLAGAALLNGLLLPDLIRCGAAFPAAVVVAFVAGTLALSPVRSASRGWTASLVGLAAVWLNLVVQGLTDPALNTSADFLGFGPGVALIGWAVGVGVAALRRRAAR